MIPVDSGGGNAVAPEGWAGQFSTMLGWQLYCHPNVHLILKN